jgi:DNA-binding HxlR family transcriptional regulator
MEEGNEFEMEKQRAEVFDALGHPKRIVILKALSEGALGFADLKKKAAIESSGNLQHHLNKLNGLIKTDEYGKYCLSDQGKDALLTVQTVEDVSDSRVKNTGKKQYRRFITKMILKPAALLLIALLIAGLAFALYVNKNTANQYEPTYNKAFGVVPNTNVNSLFSPPIPMYHALIIALEDEGWNKTSLQGLAIDAYLMNGETETNNTSTFTVINGPVTSPPADYSDVYSNGVIYRYLWEINVNNATGMIYPPLSSSFIDASTGAILPNPDKVVSFS